MKEPLVSTELVTSPVNLMVLFFSFIEPKLMWTSSLTTRLSAPVQVEHILYILQIVIINDLLVLSQGYLLNVALRLLVFTIS